MPHLRVNGLNVGYGRATVIESLDLDVKPGQKEKAIALFANGNFKRLLDWPVTRREDMDGVKVYFGDLGWVMVRASGTENLLRVYSETSKLDTTRRVLTSVGEIVRNL